MEPVPQTIDTLLINCRLAPMADNKLCPIENAAVAISNGKVAWAGQTQNLSDNAAQILKQDPKQTIDCQNGWVLPGFVDCHTHLVWAGSRSNEFEMRLNGVTYEEISKQGGGIFSTVKATRKATRKELFESASKRIKSLLNTGVTTFEIKSGYGLDLDTELKMLEVIDQLNTAFPIHIEATFLGAHTLPPEFKNNLDGYIDLITKTMLPEVKNQSIATAVDAFCERIAFSRDQTQKVFETAKDLGFNIKLHAEQLSDSDGAALAAQMRALSCDHLEYLSRYGAQQMAKHNTVAVLLPGAFYFLKESKKPPVQTLRDLNIPIAVSTDLNPGSSPIHSMPLILNMACMLFNLTCEEALLGATINGAKALGLDKQKGSIETGKDADLVVWDIDLPADLCYLSGLSPVDLLMVGGKITLNHLNCHQ
ncbi:MAG: imidazolonepropionase [Desulfobacula sp.]|nr:imidazolonepropionase [Desulfobacula sp.]